MGRLIPIVVKTRSRNGGKTPKIYASPTVVYVNEDLIQIQEPLTAGGFTVVKETLPSGEYTQYESYMKPLEIEVMRNPSSTDLYLKQLVTVSITPAGTVQGGTKATKFFSEATTVGAGATDSITLPSVAEGAPVGSVRCIVNNDAAADPLEIFPDTGATLDGAAVNAGTLLVALGGTTKFFVRTGALAWVTAVDLGR